MALAWTETRRTRAMLAALDAAARARSLFVAPRRRPREASYDVRSILVMELWNLGDLVLTLPFLTQLRLIFPRARVTLLARRYAKELLQGTDLVDDFIETDLTWKSEDTRWNPLHYRWRELLRVSREIQGREFDIAFKARMHVREHALLALSGAKRTVAFAFGKGDRVLTDPVVIEDRNRNKADDWLRLLDPFGGPLRAASARLGVSTSEREWAAQFLTEHGEDPRSLLVGVHPGASIAGKRWPLANFTSVVRQLAARPDVTPLVFIEPGGYAAELGEIPGAIPVKVGLREMIALIDRCRVLVCNDSGPMHIAGALGIPAVAIFGSGIKQWFSPLGKGHQLISLDADSASHLDPYDVNQVSVDRVMTAVEEALRVPASRG
jgi:lipopolysaccharide heptosyltransferase III